MWLSRKKNSTITNLTKNMTKVLKWKKLWLRCKKGDYDTKNTIKM